jgi:phage-related protein
MPHTEVVFYQEGKDDIPVQSWLLALRSRQPRVFVKCLAAVERLVEMGHELRRPEADLLRDGIHELRIRFGSVNYRLLYFFHERSIAVLAHALTKEAAVPSRDIDRAVERMRKFVADPKSHTQRMPHLEEVEENEDN